MARLRASAARKPQCSCQTCVSRTPRRDFHCPISSAVAGCEPSSAITTSKFLSSWRAKPRRTASSASSRLNVVVMTEISPLMASSGRSAAAVNIVQADDIIFPQIAPGLDLDQFERNLARISQPVHRPDGNIDRFVLMHGFLRIPDGDGGDAAHHDPVLGAVHVP